MKIAFLSIKGGVGKSSIAFNMAAYLGFTYITNDITIPGDPSIIQIEHKKRRIPAELCKLEEAVFDFGAMSTNLDPKISHALKIVDMVVIPTLTDPRSLQATVKTVELVRDSGKPMVLVINNYTQPKQLKAAEAFLYETLGPMPLFVIKKTTLFERVTRDGRDWYRNIHNEKGALRLRKTSELHEEIYDRIVSMAYWSQDED